MEYVLLALLLAVVVLGVLNLRKVDVKTERVIEEVQSCAEQLPELLERLDTLERRVHAIDLEPLRSDLANLRLAVDGLVEAAPVPEPIVLEAQLSREQEVRGLVDRTLAARGLAEVRLLTDPSEFDVEDLRVSVECSRDGLIVKGRVHIVGSEVRAVQLDDSLRQFP